MTAQMLMVILYGLDIGINIAKDGEPKNSRYSGGITIFAIIIHASILYWGGFWG